jgi:hypothetical protein
MISALLVGMILAGCENKDPTNSSNPTPSVVNEGAGGGTPNPLSIPPTPAPMPGVTPPSDPPPSSPQNPAPFPPPWSGPPAPDWAKTCPNGSCYGSTSPVTGTPRTTHVSGYTRSNGVHVGGYYRSK